jgi:hypothetical protein
MKKLYFIILCRIIPLLMRRKRRDYFLLCVNNIEILECCYGSCKYFFGKALLVKNRLISTLDKGIYFKETIFLWSTKPLFTSQNKAETS